MKWRNTKFRIPDGSFVCTDPENGMSMKDNILKELCTDCVYFNKEEKECKSNPLPRFYRDGYRCNMYKT